MPGKTVAQQYLAALAWLRQHPQATDDEVAEALGIHRFDRDAVLTPARVTLAGERGQ